MEEIWKDIPEYEGLYQSSNLGNVRSLDREIINSLGVRKQIKGRIRTNCNVNGYYKIKLQSTKKQKTYFVHRLVAFCFLPKSQKPEINHIDGNKLNNVVDNLEWVTRAENIQHAYDTKLRKAKAYKVMATDLNTKEEFFFSSQKEAAITLQLDPSHISKVVTGKRKHTGNFTFERI